MIMKSAHRIKRIREDQAMRLEIGEQESLRIINSVRQGGNYLILISTAFRFIYRLIRIRMLLRSVVTAATAAWLLSSAMIGRMN